MIDKSEDRIIEAMARAACLDSDPDAIVAIGYEADHESLRAERGPRWKNYIPGCRRHRAAHLAMLVAEKALAADDQ